MKLALLTFVVFLVLGVSSGSSQTPQTCTSGASSVVYGEAPVTTWYPLGCVHS
jgi:hypothetical protein